MEIKAIETRYGGCRFRSRTEARWAVYFDALNIRWEYEKEGFELPSGRYLPDFWLPGWQAWVEIKGTDPTEVERNKCFELAFASQSPVLLQSGIPSLKSALGFYPILKAGKEESAYEGEEISLDRFRECFSYLKSFVTDEETLAGLHTWNILGTIHRTWLVSDSPYFEYGCPIDAELNADFDLFCDALKIPHERILTIQDAIRQARSARFEFGEAG